MMLMYVRKSLGYLGVVWLTVLTGSSLVVGGDLAFGPRTLVLENAAGPSISVDGKSLYFSADWEGGHGGADLYVVTRETTNDPWSEPENLGPVVNSEYAEYGPTISASGLELYFCDPAFLGGERPGGFGSGDLWVSRRATTDDPWGEPVNLGETVNSPAPDWGSGISADGRELYFDSTRPGGIPGGAYPYPFDIWVTTRPTLDDPFGEPVNLKDVNKPGPTVNSPGADEAPSISNDGLWLIFHGHRAESPQGDAGDIFIASRPSTDSPWSTPELLDAPVNTLGWEAYPHVSADFPEVGSSLYFQYTPTADLFGQCDIYEVKVIPEPSTVVMLAAMGVALSVYALRRRRRAV